MVAHLRRADDGSAGRHRGRRARRNVVVALPRLCILRSWRFVSCPRAKDDMAHRSSSTPRRAGVRRLGSIPTASPDGHHRDRPGGAEHDVLALDVDADRGCHCSHPGCPQRLHGERPGPRPLPPRCKYERLGSTGARLRRWHPSGPDPEPGFSHRPAPRRRADRPPSRRRWRRSTGRFPTSRREASHWPVPITAPATPPPPAPRSDRPRSRSRRGRLARRLETR